MPQKSAHSKALQYSIEFFINLMTAKKTHTQTFDTIEKPISTLTTTQQGYNLNRTKPKPPKNHINTLPRSQKLHTKPETRVRENSHFKKKKNYTQAVWHANKQHRYRLRYR